MLRIALGLALGILLMACGGGDGPEPSPEPSKDLSGWWQWQEREAGGSATYTTGFLLEAEDLGEICWIGRREFTVSGDALRLTDRGFDGDHVYELWRASNDLLGGSYSLIIADSVVEVSDLRLVRAHELPGTLTAVGELDSVRVDVTTRGSAAYLPPGAWAQILELRSGEVRTLFGIRIGSDPVSLPISSPITFDTSNSRIDVQSASGGAYAIGGSATISKWTGTDIAGDYDITLIGGGGVTGHLKGTFRLTIVGE